MAQNQEYIVGDVIYRYESMLEEPEELFSNIKIQNQFYPCVDVMTVSESSLAQADFQLISNTGYLEYYSYKGGVLNLLGTKSNDPFLSIPDMVIQFFTPMPIISSTHQEQFDNQGSSDFFLVYKSKNWSNELREWSEENGVSEIRINGVVEWDSRYIRKDFFSDIYLEEMMGNVIEYNKKYTVNKLEVKKGKWEKIDLNENGFLQEQFYGTTEKYNSIYPIGSVVEKARIGLEPYNTFTMYINNEIGSYADCNHGTNDIYVFPNPTFDDVKIRFDHVDSPYYIFNIYNIIGKKLWTKRINVSALKDEKLIDLPPLEKGVYIYGIDNPDGKRIKSKRLVIMDL
jgi:hypothetical protein